MFQDFDLQGKKHGLNIYIPKMKTHIHDTDKKIRIVHIGQQNNLPIRNILLIGETGAGKTTMLNSLYNHYCSIKFEDGHRMRLIKEDDRFQGESQTEAITGYLFFSPSSSKYKFNVMVIDTPGINDTRGTEAQKKISKQMEVFLKEEKFGIVDLHCLAFVVKADFNRSLDYFKKFLDECMKLFVKNTHDITQILKSHAVDKNKTAEQILATWGISTEYVYNFDNGVLYGANKYGENDIDGDRIDDDEIDAWKRRWNKGIKVWDTFFQNLFQMPSMSLRITREALKEKAYLEEAKQNFSEHIETFLNEIAADMENREMLKDYKISMLENKAWQGTEKVTVKKRIPLSANQRWYQFYGHYYNCNDCNKTCTSICHMWIPCPSDDEICPVCDCKFEDHSKSDKLITETIEFKEVTDKDIEARFENAKSRVDGIEKTLDDMAKKETQLKQRIATLIKHISLHLERLNELSRITNHPTPKEIIDEVIHSITQTNTNLNMHMNDDFKAFLQSVLDESDKIEINKDDWTKKLKDKMTDADSAWDKGKALFQSKKKT